jgi:hypothetical protein
LEGALVDRSRHTIKALDGGDLRTEEIWVAGPAALLVAKVHKIAERAGSPGRERDKDALDVLRLLRAVETQELAMHLGMLGQDELAATVTIEARTLLQRFFARRESEAVLMAVRAAGTDEDPETIAGSMTELVSDLLDAWT